MALSCNERSIRLRPEWPWRARRYRLVPDESVQYSTIFWFCLSEDWCFGVFGWCVIASWLRHLWRWCRATHGLPVVRAPVYRGCPCRDPLKCHRCPGRMASGAERQPLWLCCVGGCGHVMWALLIHAFLKHVSSSSFQAALPIIIKPMMTIQEISLKIVFYSPEFNRSIIVSK